MIVTALAQTAVALRSGHSVRAEGAFFVEIKWWFRIYAITDRNKLFGGALSVVITTQLVFGTYYIAQTAMGPSKLLKLCSIGVAD